MRTLTRRLPLFTSTAFGLLILATAAAAGLRSLSYAVPAGTDLMQGGLTRSFESHYDKVFPVRTLGTNLWGAVQYTVFGEGRTGVVVGRDGWLYTQEEFRDYESAPVRIAERLASISEVRDALKAQGSELVVALLPSKARLYPEHYGRERPAALHHELYLHLLEALTQRGIAAPDLLQALERCKEEDAVFLRTDTHWTPAGAQCSAQALAAALGRDRGGEQAYRTQIDPPTVHRGDLMQFLPLSPYFEALLPLPDPLSLRHTVPVLAAEADLLGETAAPDTVLVGTSYSADARWNFDGALRQALHRDVLNLAAAGRGPFAPMQDYLATPPATSPRLVIWEIPERYLPAPDTRPDTASELKLADAHP